MLTKLCCDKWFISTTLNLKACHISSFYLQSFVQTSTVPSAKTLSTPCSFAHSCVFVAMPHSLSISDLVRIIESFKLLWPSVLLLSSSQKRGSLFMKRRRMLTSHFVERISNNAASGCVIFWSGSVFFAARAGLTCARWVMFNLNRFDVRDYRCLLARSHAISETSDRILKPVDLLQSAKMFTWEMLEFFIDRKCSKEFPRIIFCTINSFKILQLFY